MCGSPPRGGTARSSRRIISGIVRLSSSYFSKRKAAIPMKNRRLQLSQKSPSAPAGASVPARFAHIVSTIFVSATPSATRIGSMYTSSARCARFSRPGSTSPVSQTTVKPPSSRRSASTLTPVPLQAAGTRPGESSRTTFPTAFECAVLRTRTSTLPVVRW